MTMLSLEDIGGVFQHLVRDRANGARAAAGGRPYGGLPIKRPGEPVMICQLKCFLRRRRTFGEDSRRAASFARILRVEVDC